VYLGRRTWPNPDDVFPALPEDGGRLDDDPPSRVIR
jgi:hypothetical protein